MYSSSNVEAAGGDGTAIPFRCKSHQGSSRLLGILVLWACNCNHLDPESYLSCIRMWWSLNEEPAGGDDVWIQFRYQYDQGSSKVLEKRISRVLNCKNDDPECHLALIWNGGENCYRSAGVNSTSVPF